LLQEPLSATIRGIAPARETGFGPGQAPAVLRVLAAARTGDGAAAGWIDAAV
jgi:hypothetical protein